jgi:xylulokinase
VRNPLSVLRLPRSPILSAALFPMRMLSGDAVVSLGTSDTVLLASNDYLPDPDYHVFGHPMGDAPGGKRRYMAM